MHVCMQGVLRGLYVRINGVSTACMYSRSKVKLSEPVFTIELCPHHSPTKEPSIQTDCSCRSGWMVAMVTTLLVHWSIPTLLFIVWLGITLYVHTFDGRLNSGELDEYSDSFIITHSLWDLPIVQVTHNMRMYIRMYVHRYTQPYILRAISTCTNVLQVSHQWSHCVGHTP